MHLLSLNPQEVIYIVNMLEIHIYGSQVIYNGKLDYLANMCIRMQKTPWLQSPARQWAAGPADDTRIGQLVYMYQ